MQSSNQHPGFDQAPLAVDIDLPGFFPYARFSPSASRGRQARVRPLSQSSEFAVWPNVVARSESATSTQHGKKSRGTY
jgi:hypothetical protein